jgi:hypothetical protein
MIVWSADVLTDRLTRVPGSSQPENATEDDAEKNSQANRRVVGADAGSRFI